MIDTLNFEKLNGILPAIIQDAETNQVLMVGFMNREALEKTDQEKKVTFWSRTKQRLWMKGETSGNILEVNSMQADCDNDAVLIKATPAGPVCHEGTYTCFDEEKTSDTGFVLRQLEGIIAERKRNMPEGSYTTSLFRSGSGRIAQKVGEEAVEVVVAALQPGNTALRMECADLLYHLLVLLRDRDINLQEVAQELQSRMKS